ncbi:MAG: hypothetical protein M3Y48_09545 [Actinomycetota bacterium]|nr:hypothetical protein [Actinomycetota bacterium]
MDPTVNVAASQAAHRGNNEPLRAMLNELVGDDADARDVPDERTPASRVRWHGGQASLPEHLIDRAVAVAAGGARAVTDCPDRRV